MAVLKTAKTTEAYHSFQHLGRCLLRFCWIRLVTSFCGAKCGFTPGRSTTDRIFTLNNIIQSRKEFQKPLWIAFVDFNAWTFDSVDRMALWKLLRSLGLHSKVVDLMEGLYTDTCSCVYVDGVMSDWFAVGSGVRQGCRIAPDLFPGPMDHMMERTVHRGMFSHWQSCKKRLLRLVFEYIGRKPKSYRSPLPPIAQQFRWQMDMLKWSMHLSIWVAWLTPLVAAGGRFCVRLA